MTNLSNYDAQLIPACIVEEWAHCAECGASEEDVELEVWDDGGATLCNACKAKLTQLCAKCGERAWIENIDDDGICDCCNRKAQLSMGFEDQLTDESLGR